MEVVLSRVRDSVWKGEVGSGLGAPAVCYVWLILGREISKLENSIKLSV